MEVPEHEVSIHIFSAHKFEVNDIRNRPPLQDITLAVLKGFDGKNQQMDLVLKNDHEKFRHEGKIYTRYTLQDALYAGQENIYPLHFHKKLRYLKGNEKLNILMYDNDNHVSYVPMPDDIKQKILRFLLIDTADGRYNAFHFCKEIMHTEAPVENKDLPILDFLTFSSKIKVGDALVLASRKIKDAVNILRFRNYAIALGRGLYLSKLGVQGQLYVTSLQSLMNFWKCHIFAKLESGIELLKSWLDDPFQRILFRQINLHVYPMKNFDIENNFQECFAGGIGAVLTGFQYANKQVLLDVNAQHNTFAYGHILYTSDSLQKALLQNVIDRHPLQWHKKLRFMIGDELLFIFKRDDSETQSLQIDISSKITKKILAYLRHDQKKLQRQCWDFCYNVCFDVSDAVNNSLQLKDQIEIIEDESLLKPGDPIGIFEKIPGKDKIKFTHFALVLDKGIYMSKFGNGGNLFVTTMATMINYYRSHGFARLKQALVNVPDFVINIFQSIKLHSK